jgi:hypothetical protein
MGYSPKMPINSWGHISPSLCICVSVVHTEVKEIITDETRKSEKGLPNYQENTRKKAISQGRAVVSR